MGTPRTRSDSSVVPGASLTMYGKKYNGTTSDKDYYTTQSASMTADSSTESKTMNDVVTPNFLSRIKRGEIINNAMDSTTEIVTAPVATPFHRKTVNKWANDTLHGDTWDGSWAMTSESLGTFKTPGSVTMASIESLVDKAVTDAHANASSAELSLLMVAAEGRKTVDSLASIMYRVLKIAKALKKAEFSYLKRELSWKNLQERYMELRYAIRPLVYDAQGLCNALEAEKLAKSMRATARGFASDTWTDSDSYTTTSYYGATMTVNRKWTCVVDIRAGVLTDVELSHLSIWGMDQALETMWELVPLSFVLDWFIDVGNTIAAWTPSAGVKELASWVSITRVITSENWLGSIENTSSFDHWDEFSWSGKKTRVEVHKERRTNPNLSFWPSVNIQLDALKIADLAIILRQLTNRKRVI